MIWSEKIVGFLGDAVRNLRASPAAHLLSLATITISLFILSAFLLAYRELSGVLERWGEKVQVVAYLKEEIPPSAVEALRLKIAALPGIRSARFVSKEEALATLKGDVRGLDDVLDGLGENPLVGSFEVTLTADERSAEGIARVASALRGLGAFGDLDYGQEWVGRFWAVLRTLRALALGAGLLLLAGVASLIANTIKLSLYARREEIEIRKLVGATRWHIRIPFLLEGAIQGVVGAGAALLLLTLAVRVFSGHLDPALSIVLGGRLRAFLSPEDVLQILGGGGLAGLAGGLVSVGRFLKGGA